MGFWPYSHKYNILNYVNCSLIYITILLKYYINPLYPHLSFAHVIYYTSPNLKLYKNYYILCLKYVLTQTLKTQNCSL